MKKIIGCLLVGLSFLTTAIIIALGQISITLKEVATGNYSFANSYDEISTLAYIAIIITVIIGIFLIKDNKNDKPS